MKIRTKVKAGGIALNHNAAKKAGVTIRTKVRAGCFNVNHSAVRR